MIFTNYNSKFLNFILIKDLCQLNGCVLKLIFNYLTPRY